MGINWTNNVFQTNNVSAYWENLHLMCNFDDSQSHAKSQNIQTKLEWKKYEIPESYLE